MRKVSRGELSISTPLSLGSATDQFQGTAPTTTGSDGMTIVVHEAWAVTWVDSDRSTLTPKLPDLTSSMSVPTWTPGDKIPKGKYDRDDSKSEEEFFGHDLYWFMIVGIPVMTVVLALPCVWCCVRCCRRSRRKKKVAARESITQTTTK